VQVSQPGQPSPRDNRCPLQARSPAQLPQLTQECVGVMLVTDMHTNATESYFLSGYFYYICPFCRAAPQTPHSPFAPVPAVTPPQLPNPAFTRIQAHAADDCRALQSIETPLHGLPRPAPHSSTVFPAGVWKCKSATRTKATQPDSSSLPREEPGIPPGPCPSTHPPQLLLSSPSTSSLPRGSRPHHR